MKDLFRYFIRKNFSELDEITNEDIDEIGVEFHNYLDNKLSEEQKQNILPKDVMSVILQADHPFKTNGFEPAYVLHFTQWIKESVEKELEEE
jgi:hypothetical protein